MKSDNMSIRTRCTQVFTFFQQNKSDTIRKAAAATGISKSSTHRHKQAIRNRNRYPESLSWETEAGQVWFTILVCATLYVFGIRCGVGMETISEFFKMLRLEKHIGISATSLHRKVAEIEGLILKYKETFEKNSGGTARVIVGADETFFDKMILVMIELSTGYILIEDPAENRTCETWKEKAIHALERLGLKTAYMVSDNAKALVKLASSGIQCSRIPDLFHAMNEIVKVMGARFANKAARIHGKISKEFAALELLMESGKNPEKVTRKQKQIEALKTEHEIIVKGQTRYYDLLHNFSKAVHPFSTDENGPLTSKDVVEKLLVTLYALKALAVEYEIKDNKNALDKVEKQIREIAALIDIWWIWVKETIAHYNLDADKTDWLLYTYLPVIYWEIQLKRTSSKSLSNSYEQAYERAQSVLNDHPLTAHVSSEEIKQWQSWAHWIATKFQRTSSAVEGRNGALSRMNHNQRSIPLTRLKALTVIHNFGIKRQDGTTAAQRLFGQKFPDLFEWIVERVGELPCPREHSVNH